MEKMNNKLKLMSIITEAVQFPNFLNKWFRRLYQASYQLEDAFIRDLERLNVEGKIGYDKFAKKITSIDYSKLTDDDLSLLMRSYNFRKSVLDTFDELNINGKTKADAMSLSGPFLRIGKLLWDIPESKVIRGKVTPGNVNVWSVTTKTIGDFLRKNKGTSFMLRLFRKYEASMKEWVELEKQIKSETDSMLGKLRNSDPIAEEVKKINALILRAREFDKKSPKLFWDSIKGDLLAKDNNGKLIIDRADEVVEAVENSKYYTVFRDRFASMTPESTKTPSNTISRYDGFVKIFTRPIVGGRPDFWEGVLKATKKFILPTEWANSRVVSMLTLLDTRTINELKFNVSVRGKTMSATSYFSYKLALIYGIYPIMIQSFSSLIDTLTLQFTYTEEELQELFNGKQSDEFWVNYITILSYNLEIDYETPTDLLWEWSPIINIVRSTQNLTNGKDTIRDRLEDGIRDARGEIREKSSRLKNFTSWLKSTFTNLFSDDETSPTPAPPTPTATAAPTTNTEPLPAPPTDPNAVSEEITNAEVDAFIDANLVELKDLIVKPYTVNSDKTVTLYVSGQNSPISILFKVGGKITIKNSN
jgi:hypothetical protein